MAVRSRGRSVEISGASRHVASWRGALRGGRLSVVGKYRPRKRRSSPPAEIVDADATVPRRAAHAVLLGGRRRVRVRARDRLRLQQSNDAAAARDRRGGARDRLGKLGAPRAPSRQRGSGDAGGGVQRHERQPPRRPGASDSRRVSRSPHAAAEPRAVHGPPERGSRARRATRSINSRSSSSI